MRLWRSVRVRITVVSVVVFALAFGAAASVLVSTVRRTLVDQLEGEQQLTVSKLSKELESGAPPPGVLGEAGALPPGMFVCRVDAPEPGTGDMGVRSCLGAAKGPVVAKPPGAGGVAADEKDLLVRTFEVETPAGVQTLRVASPLEPVRRSVETLTRVLVVATPLLVLGVGIMVWSLVGRALRPVERLRAEVDAISHSTLDRRVRLPGSDDEIERLARTMNDMLDRLQRAASEQQRFVSDASHELRTPLSVIRTTIDVSREHPATLPPADALDRIDRATTRTEDLVEELLALARIGEVGAAEAVEVDLRRLVADAVAHLGDGRIRTTGGPAPVRGDPGQLRRLVDNLVGNAGAHRRSQVVVDTSVDGDSAVIVVDDDGPGIPPGARAAVFERFARLEDSRARAGGTGGWGLGLAIAHAVVQRHHGTIEVGDAPLGGARFTVRLPAAPGRGG